MEGNDEAAGDDERWSLWDYRGTAQWPEHWPPVRFRRIDDRRIAFEATPPAGAANMQGALHGGFLASFAETMLGIFVVPFDLPIDTVTVSLSIDYPAGGSMEMPLEGQVELLRETGRMQFVRLDVRQADTLIVSAGGVLRKVPRL